MPVNETEFPKPSIKPLKFSAARKFTWNTVPADSIHPPVVYPFDMTKLPSQPFNPTGSTAITSQILDKPFLYDELPDTALNIDSLPAKPLANKTMLLAKIKKITLGSPKLKADSYQSFFQYDEDQGLPSQQVEALLHTRNGLIWVATPAGLCIIDGQTMEVLPYNYGDIFLMNEDADGKIWMTTRNNGVFMIDRKAGIQKQFPELTAVIDVRSDKKGFIWVTSYLNGLYRISQDRKTFIHITVKNGLSSNSLIRVREDSAGRIWITHFSAGIDILDPANMKIKKLGSVLGNNDKKITALLEDQHGNMIAVGSVRGSVDIFNIGSHTLRIIDSLPLLARHEIFEMKLDDQNRIWITTDSAGIIILNQHMDSLTQIGPVEGLSQSIVLGLENGNNHEMLVGTFKTGLSIFPDENHIAHHISEKQGLVNDQDWSILEDSNNRMWIGTYNGVNIVTEDKKIHLLQINPHELLENRIDGITQLSADRFALTGSIPGLWLIDEAAHTLEKFNDKQGLPKAKMRYTFQDSRGRLWIETVDKGLILFDIQNKSIKNINETTGLSADQVSGIVEIGNEKFLVATYGGVNLLDLKENTISTYSTKEGLTNDNVVNIIKDHKNRYWAITEKGLNLIDLADQTNTTFTLQNGLPSNGVYSIIEKEGRIFAGTGKGLVILDESTESDLEKGPAHWSIQTYGKSMGLSYLDFNGNAITSTRNGWFWWGIQPGISVLNELALKRDSSAPPTITSLDFFGKPQYFTDPSLIVPVDTLWSETKDSFYLNAGTYPQNSDKEKGIYWNELTSKYLPVGLSLPSNQNYLRFHFDHYLPDKDGDYKYQYLLEGADEKWSPISDLPYTENYSNLSSGSYTFLVSCRKGNGFWSAPSSFQFRIRPPWWLSWWAELIYFLLFAGLLRLWVKYRSRRLKKENLILEKKVSDRTTALSTSLENLRQAQGQLIQAEKMASLGELTAGIAHEIQNPLNFVNNFSEVNTELIEDVQKALDSGDLGEAKQLLKDIDMNMGKITFHGKRADTIVKGMLLHSRANSGQKTLTNINVLADEYLRLSYHGLRARDKSFNALFQMELDERMDEIMLVSQDIGRVFLNLFNNGFYAVTEKRKISAAGYEPTVIVKTKRKTESVEIRIHDNGMGIPKKVLDKIYQPFFTTKPAGQGTGLGLSLSYDIVTKEHGGKIDVVTKENEYTEFIIEIPVRTQELKPAD